MTRSERNQDKQNLEAARRAGEPIYVSKFTGIAYATNPADQARAQEAARITEANQAAASAAKDAKAQRAIQENKRNITRAQEYLGRDQGPQQGSYYDSQGNYTGPRGGGIQSSRLSGSVRPEGVAELEQRAEQAKASGDSALYQQYQSKIAQTYQSANRQERARILARNTAQGQFTTGGLSTGDSRGAPQRDINYRTSDGRTQTIFEARVEKVTPLSPGFAGKAATIPGLDVRSDNRVLVREDAQGQLQSTGQPVGARLEPINSANLNALQSPLDIGERNYTPVGDNLNYSPDPRLIALNKFQEGLNTKVPFVAGNVTSVNALGVNYYSNPLTNTLFNSPRQKTYIEKALNINLDEPQKDNRLGLLFRRSDTDFISNNFRNNRQLGRSGEVNGETSIPISSVGSIRDVSKTDPFQSKVDNFIYGASSIAEDFIIAPARGIYKLSNIGAQGLVATADVVLGKPQQAIANREKVLKQVITDSDIHVGAIAIGAGLAIEALPILTLPAITLSIGQEVYSTYKNPSIGQSGRLAGVIGLSALAFPEQIAKGISKGYGAAREFITKAKYTPVGENVKPINLAEVNTIYDVKTGEIYKGNIKAGRALSTERATTDLVRQGKPGTSITSTEELIASQTELLNTKPIEGTTISQTKTLSGSGVFEYNTRFGVQKINIERTSITEPVITLPDEAAAVRNTQTKIFFGENKGPGLLTNQQPDLSVNSRALVVKNVKGIIPSSRVVDVPDLVINSKSIIEAKRSNVGIDFVEKTRIASLQQQYAYNTKLTAGRLQEYGKGTIVRSKTYTGSPVDNFKLSDLSVKGKTTSFLRETTPFAQRELPKVYFDAEGKPTYEFGTKLSEFEGAPLESTTTSNVQHIAQSDYSTLPSSRKLADFETGEIITPKLDYPLTKRRDLLFAKTITQKNTDISKTFKGAVPGPKQIEFAGGDVSYQYVRKYSNTFFVKKPITADDIFGNIKSSSTGKPFSPFVEKQPEPPVRLLTKEPAKPSEILKENNQSVQLLTKEKTSSRSKDISPSEAINRITERATEYTNEDIIGFAKKATEERINKVRNQNKIRTAELVDTASAIKPIGRLILAGGTANKINNIFGKKPNLSSFNNFKIERISKPAIDTDFGQERKPKVDQKIDTDQTQKYNLFTKFPNQNNPPIIIPPDIVTPSNKPVVDVPGLPFGRRSPSGGSKNYAQSRNPFSGVRKYKTADPKDILKRFGGGSKQTISRSSNDVRKAVKKTSQGTKAFYRTAGRGRILKAQGSNAQLLKFSGKKKKAKRRGR